MFLHDMHLTPINKVNCMNFVYGHLFRHCWGFHAVLFRNLKTFVTLAFPDGIPSSWSFLSRTKRPCRSTAMPLTRSVADGFDDGEEINATEGYKILLSSKLEQKENNVTYMREYDINPDLLSMS